MQFAATGFGNVGLGSIEQDPGVTDTEYLSPIKTEWNGLDARRYLLADTLRIQDTLGQPCTCSFSMVTPEVKPLVGDKIRVLYFSQVIFSGTIDHIGKSSPDLSTFFYTIDCLDWSQTLIRRKLRRNFTNLPIQNILSSILANELAGETLTTGMIESRASMPLVDSRDGKVLDVCRNMATATGMTFFVDFDQSIQMRSTTAPAAPLILNEGNTLLIGTNAKDDRETYRNVQIVNVTGTPVASETALTTTQTRRNADQIAQRKAIEGGTGIYEEIVSITHPTSNDAGQIALLGIGVANTKLAVSGTPRLTFICQARGYGFRAGQIATVNLPTFGISGTFAIQRVTFVEKAGQFLFHDLELTTSSLQQRAYETWLGVVTAGKVTVQSPSAITNNLQTFNTPGTYHFIVPAGTTILELTCVGASGSGGGGASYTGLQNGNPPYPCAGGGLYSSSALGVNGGKGGSSGRAVTILNVNTGDDITIVVGAAGVAGISDDNVYHNLTIGSGPESTTSTDGAIGTASSASYRGSVVCQGNGGDKGLHGTVTISIIIIERFIPRQRICLYPGTDASDLATGIGDAVSTGGGKAGGARGTGIPLIQPFDGSDGLVEVRW